MNDGIYKIGPVYSSRVKISGWDVQYLQYPLDNPKRCIRGGSHYKTLGPTDEVFIPKTTTQEMLEQYRNVRKQTKKGLLHPMINFTSYPLIENGKAFNAIKTLNEPKKSKCQTAMSSYKYDFYNMRKITYENPAEICKKETLHPLLNRLPKSDFDKATYALSPTMFMDDHFYNMSEQRKCNNFLRQLKKTSYVPWLGDYQKFHSANEKCPKS